MNKQKQTAEVSVKEMPAKPKVSKKDTWEIKDRNYYLIGGRSPLTFTLASKHTKRFPLLWFDKEKGYERELRYATNQKSPFVDEQEGTSTLAHLVFENGVLPVPKHKQSLQKLLSLYHPSLGRIYKELQPQKIAQDELVNIKLEIAAGQAALEMDVDQSEAILRVEEGSKVEKMSSKELKRDIVLFAKKNPKLFMDLANDENVELRNFALKAQSAGIIKLAQDQRTVRWASNDRKLFTVPFDENPWSACAAFFKTDEGVEVFKTIKKRLT
tara:strand:- start:1342 stop:2151 length:810 start_codon:yes stop_codon:yes gene_type:complete